jgi:hypothetical protein
MHLTQGGDAEDIYDESYLKEKGAYIDLKLGSGTGEEYLKIVTRDGVQAGDEYLRIVTTKKTGLSALDVQRGYFVPK